VRVPPVMPATPSGRGELVANEHVGVFVGDLSRAWSCVRMSSSVGLLALASLGEGDRFGPEQSVGGCRR
jgi:hypothetical protein